MGRALRWVGRRPPRSSARRLPSARQHLLVELERALGDIAILFLPRAELRETELGLGVERFALNAEDGVGGGFARGGGRRGCVVAPGRREARSAARYRHHLHLFAGGATGGDHGATSERRDARSRRVRDSRGRESARGPSARGHHRSDRAALQDLEALHFAKRPKGDFFFQKAYPGHRAVVRSPTLFVSRASVEVTSRDDSPQAVPGMSATPRDTATRVTLRYARATSMSAAFVLFAAVRAYPPTRELCALQRCEDLPGLFPAEYPPNAVRSRERSHLDAVLSSGMRLPATRRHAARTHLTSWALAYREAHVATSARRTHPTRACAAPRTHPTVPARHARQPPRRGCSSPKERSSSRITSGSPRIPSDHTSRLRESERVMVYARETTEAPRGARSRSARDARRLHLVLDE